MTKLTPERLANMRKNPGYNRLDIMWTVAKLLDHIDALQKELDEEAWLPIARMHEDYGSCICINIHDPGSEEISSNLNLDYKENLEWYGWTHFKPIHLSTKRAEELIAAMTAKDDEDA